MPPSEHTAPHLDNREPHIGHETRDVNIPAIVLLAAAVAATVLVVLVLLWYLMRAMEFAAIHDEPALSPLADTQQTPPAPRLQDAPVRDYASYHENQEAYLGSYGWVDRQQTVAHIPIEQAMKLLVERGWPKTTGSGQPQQPAKPGAKDQTHQPNVRQNQQSR